MTPVQHKPPFNDRLTAIIEGSLALPNFEPLPADQILGTVASCRMGATYGWGKVKHTDHRKWAVFWLGTTQGGEFDGTGYVAIWHHTQTTNVTSAITGRFSVCVHEYSQDPSSRPHEGHRVGRCELCGLNMSCDSSG